MESYVNQMCGRLWLAYDLFVEAEKQAVKAALTHTQAGYPFRADGAMIARNNYHVMTNWLLFIASGKSNGDRLEAK